MDAIDVYAWNQQVGQVRQDPATGYYGLSYSPQWLEQGAELAPLMLAKRTGLLVSPKLSEATWHRVPALLAGALPDDFGTTLSSTWLERTLGRAPTILDRLGALGEFSMGALDFRGGVAPGVWRDSLSIEQLVEASNRTVNGQLDGTDPGLAALMCVGSVAGGQRAKVVVGWNEATNTFIDGRPQTLPAGHTHWLVKFDGVMPHSKDGAFEPGLPLGKGRVEYAYYLMGRAAGLDIMESRLLEEQGRAHFMTRRFDRVGGHKQHVATLCDMAHMDYKTRATHTYDSLFDTISQLELGDEAKHQAFRRMCFNVMGRNQDDHTKNFAFLLEQGKAWTLAPAYDLTYANNPKSEWVYQHLMGVNGKFRRIDRDDLRAVGARWNVPGINQALEDVAGAIRRWPEFAARAGVAEHTARAIHLELFDLAPGRRKSIRWPKS